MSRHTSRVDRVAQMSVQEEIIARKKLELIEKQKTAELAKQVVAAQAGTTKPKKEKEKPTGSGSIKSIATQETPAPKNFFSNDGSFFENFKKITDAVRKTQPDALPKALIEEAKEPPQPELVEEQPPPPAEPETLNETENIPIEKAVLDVNIDTAALCAQPPPPPPPPPPSESTVTNAKSSSKTTSNESPAPAKPIPSLMDTVVLPPPDFQSKKGFKTQPSMMSPEPDNFNQKNHGSFQPKFNPQNDSKFSSDQGSDTMNRNFSTRLNQSSGGQNTFQQNSNNRSDQLNFSNRFASGNLSAKFTENMNNFNNQSDQMNMSNRYQDNSDYSNDSNSGPNQMQSSDQSNNFFQSNQSNRFQSNQSNRFQQDNRNFSADQSNRFAGGNQQQMFSMDNSFGDPNQPCRMDMNRADNNANEMIAQNQRDQNGSQQSLNIFNDIDERVMPDQPFGSNPFNKSFGRSPFDMEEQKSFSNPTSNSPFNPTPNSPFNQNQPPPNSSGGFAQEMPAIGRFNQPPPQQQQQQPQQQQNVLNNKPIIGPTTFSPSIPPPMVNAPSFQHTQQPPIFTQTQIPPLINTQQLTTMGVSNSTPQTSQISMVQYPPLHTIPPPMPLSLNKIPPPKELDLNAIPEPKLNLDAIKIPEFSYGRDNEFYPTSVESLVELVAENGDDYEEKILSRKCDLHSSLWFLTDKCSTAYVNYRQKVLEYRHSKNTKSIINDDANDLDKYDPEEIYNEYNKDDDDVLPLKNDYKQQQQQLSDDQDYDSDSAYMSESKRRNTDHLKRKLTTKITCYSSDEDEMEMEAQKIQDKIEHEQGTSSECGNNKRNKKKRSRWGEKVETSGPVPLMSLSLPTMQSVNTLGGNAQKPMLTSITRSDPALLQYARQNYGSINLSEEDWKKCEDHYKISLLYQDMLKKRQDIDRLAKTGRFKYEYDSDEDVNGGTWEHKLRNAEMEATTVWAEALNKQSEGKHHIGDFLPPEELRKFMEKYNSKQTNREPDLSDYKEYKLKEDNIGFQMLQKLGWKEGQGLGTDGSGIVNPVNNAPQRDSNQGLGALQTETDFGDNEYDAYRKRMMLAYRFRPNPLNNPRRAYY